MGKKGSYPVYGFGIRFVGVTVFLLCLVVYLNYTFTDFRFKRDLGRIFYEIVLVLIVSSALASGKIWEKIKFLGIWAVIFLVLLVGYSYRFEMRTVKDKVMAELFPARGFQQTDTSISFPVSSDGHFYIEASVNDNTVTFLADTGATQVVLSPSDAKKIGINTAGLVYDRFFETANGIVRGSSIRISALTVGGIQMHNVRASVNEAGMRHSLLGMSFFSRLKSYEVKQGVLTLYGESAASQ